MQLHVKDPVYKNLCTLTVCKFIILSAIVGMSGLIVATSKWQRIVRRARKKEVGNESNDKGSKYSLTP